jgi:hypothetical protein
MNEENELARRTGVFDFLFDFWAADTKLPTLVFTLYTFSLVMDHMGARNGDGLTDVQRSFRMDLGNFGFSGAIEGEGTILYTCMERCL